MQIRIPGRQRRKPTVVADPKVKWRAFTRAWPAGGHQDCAAGQGLSSSSQHQDFQRHLSTPGHVANTPSGCECADAARERVPGANGPLAALALGAGRRAACCGRRRVCRCPAARLPRSRSIPSPPVWSTAPTTACGCTAVCRDPAPRRCGGLPPECHRRSALLLGDVAYGEVDGEDEPVAMPQIVTLSYHDAGRWLDAQETVERVDAAARSADV